MKEDNNISNDQPTEEQKPSDETQVEYRELSDEDLKWILVGHDKWIGSDKAAGKRADLTLANLERVQWSLVNLQEADLFNANLKKANLKGVNLQKAYLLKANLQMAGLEVANLQGACLDNANLQGANLRRANLQSASLKNVNLKGANLWSANLQETNLDNANLQGANLWNAKLLEASFSKEDMQKTVLERIEGLNKAKDLNYANFQGATGLLGKEFAQADVTGAKLPDDIKEFKALEIVKETSQNARKIFFAMLLGCVYSWLTIATTTDVRLLTNTASSPLPIIQTEIPIVGFYWAAPLVLICLYFYFHLYLLKIWEGLSGLPAIFPDGKRLDERAYPWLLNGLVRRHFGLLKTERPFIAHIQEWITIFLAWWVVPITMIAFWLRYIPRHEWKGTFFHIGLIVVSVAFAIIFYRLCSLTLKGDKKRDFRLLTFLWDRRFYYGVSVVAVGIIFSFVSYGAIEGLRVSEPSEQRKTSFNSIKDVVPWAFEKVGYNVFAEIRENSVSEIPANYGEIAKEERLNFVKGANLIGRNLNSADMYNAFLVKANLRDAVLNNAILDFSDLQQANLNRTSLKRANLYLANLQQVNLMESKLQDANLREANLQEANLRKTEGIKAQLFGANLKKADLSCANLEESVLGFANLQQAFLTCASLKKAILADANLQQANLNGTNLKEANLNRANLKEATIGRANYWHALMYGAKLPRFVVMPSYVRIMETNLEGADLSQANFIRADLRKVKNLTIEQLSKVKTLYQTKLDPELMEQVKKCCPHLLEKPKEEKETKNAK